MATDLSGTHKTVVKHLRRSRCATRPFVDTFVEHSVLRLVSGLQVAACTMMRTEISLKRINILVTLILLLYTWDYAYTVLGSVRPLRCLHAIAEQRGYAA